MDAVIIVVVVIIIIFVVANFATADAIVRRDTLHSASSSCSNCHALGCYPSRHR